MVWLFNTIIYEPIYNGFVFLLETIPGADVGISVILITLIVRVALLPLAHGTVASQAKIRELEPEIKKIKEEYKKDKQEQARKTMELYRTHKINPFSGLLSMIIIQIPVMFGLFYVFLKGITPELNTSILYSFINLPAQVNFEFLGSINMTEQSIAIAVLAGISQYIQISLALKSNNNKKNEEVKAGQPTFKEEMFKNMKTQIRYILPGVVLFISATMPSAVALYWTTSNIVSICHETYVKKNTIKK